MHFRIRRAHNILPSERETCERYGENVVGSMLAGGFTPSSEDLQALYHDEQSRAHARDWLTERADYRERHDW
jgi:hypothetical protein